MKVRIRIDNRIRVKLAKLEDEVCRALKQEFEHRNPQFFLHKALGLPTWSTPVKIITWEETDTELTFPRGGMQRVRDVLKSSGHTWGVVDDRSRGTTLTEELQHAVTLRGYQVESVDALVALENCILRAPTGCGKTTILFALAARVGVATLVIVPNRKLFDQWMKRAVKELGLKSRDVGVIQGKRRVLKPLTIAMQKTLAAKGIDAEMNRYFGAVFADEAQLFAAGTFFKCIDGFSARYRIAVSADHRRKDKKEFLVEDLFGAVAKEIKRATLIASGDVLDVEIRVLPSEFRAEWYGMPTDAEDSSSSVERVDKELDFDRLLKEMAADRARNRLIIDTIADEVQGHGSQVIVTVHHREHCLVIDQAVSARSIRSGFLIGGPEYAKEFEATDDAMQKGTTRVGIGTFKSIGYGVDMPHVGVGVAGTPIAANEQFWGQVRGRLCRAPKGKTKATLYYVWDQHVYGMKHLRNIVRWNAKVFVRYRDEWVPGREYVKRQRQVNRAAANL